jgi:Phycobilisome degradation protein nblA
MTDINKQMTELTLEQQFKVRSFNQDVDRMNLEQSRQFLKELHKQMIVKDAIVKELLKQSLIGDISAK